jgi:CRP/FNR family cyclic AMP-dependent transcriptional regulator
MKLEPGRVLKHVAAAHEANAMRSVIFTVRSGFCGWGLVALAGPRGARQSHVMQTLDELLAEHPFFVGLDPQTLVLLAGCATNVHFRPGDYLFRQDGPADHFYVLRRGRVQLQVTSPAEGPLVLETYEHNDVLGWSWLIPPYHCEADAQATEDTDAIAFDGVCLRGKCDNDAALGYELLKRTAADMHARRFAALARLLDLYGPTRVTATDDLRNSSDLAQRLR